ncbi:DUF1264 domain-containing protein [Methylohalobius crimeensis]|uniref:DUF1264 domain-containing protein n=1 Tax=Methylohalobius crimeensis TaxID=244365 RepID=UPI0003B65B52|nr:DUF1264 domain-containing protein [Methylohalobius crimeensis]
MNTPLKFISSAALAGLTSIAYSASQDTHGDMAAEAVKLLQAEGSTSQPMRPYNQTYNPRQKEYPNHLGFNDLHIQALRHLPDGDIDPRKLRHPVHHHCKAYDDGTFVCLMFHSGMKDQDKPIGFEYIIPTSLFQQLPAEEKQYWHYHKEEIPMAKATFPDLTPEETAEVLPKVNETYGKVIYFHHPDDELPLGQPYILDVHSMPRVD